MPFIGSPRKPRPAAPRWRWDVAWSERGYTVSLKGGEFYLVFLFEEGSQVVQIRIRCGNGEQIVHAPISTFRVFASAVDDAAQNQLVSLSPHYRKLRRERNG